MADRMSGPRGKTKRAKQHVNELEAAIAEFFGTNPYEVGAEDDPEAGQRVYKLTKAEAPPDCLALIAGDIVHNLRASLDLVVWQLVEVNGKTPGKSDGFPINESAQAFEPGGIAKVKSRISNEAVKVVRAVKPYKGGNDALWRLHHLDIADKHRILFVVGSSYRSFKPALPPMLLPDGTEIPFEFPGFLIPEDKMFPLEEGDEIYREPLNHETKDKPQFRFEIAFGQGEVVEGEPILPALNDLVGATEQTIELFAPLL
jgi:hypothetical protein